MNYSAYLLLALLFTYSVGPSGTEPVSEGVQKLFNIMKYHMATCPKEGSGFSLYECPSHLWPELVQNFIPLVSSLQVWIKQRIGAGAAIWYPLAKKLKCQIVKYDPQALGEIRDEVIAWTLLTRYLKFEKLDLEWRNHLNTRRCLASTLDALTDLELEQVSRLPYHRNSDLFEEINELVNDPKKARLLDGLKRASRNDFEMSNMLASLHRWLKRFELDNETAVIFYAAFDTDMRNLPIEQLNAETISVPNFQGDPELAGVFGVIFGSGFYDELDKNKSFLHDSLPQSLPSRDHIISVLTRLGDETRDAQACRSVMESALEFYRDSKYWDEVLSYKECVMIGLSKLPDEIFEEYEKLTGGEQYRLDMMFLAANLPSLYVSA